MKSYAGPIAVSAVVFITMLQPCPAPIVSTLAIAGAGAALFGGGVGVGAWASGHGASSVKQPIIVNANPELTQRQDLTPFENCAFDGLNTAQTIDFPANGSIIVSDLPQSCMEWFDHYNLHPQIDLLNDAHGSITALNSSAVELANLPPYVMTYVESTLLNGTKQTKTLSRARRALVAAEALTV